jgi:sulfofructose kinase
MSGFSCLDHIWQLPHFPPTESRTLAKAYQSVGGGIAASAAATAARLGAEVQLLTIHGKDANADVIEEELKRFGVKNIQGRFEQVATPVSGILVDHDGERYIFPYRDDALFDIREGWNFEHIQHAQAVMVDTRYPYLNQNVIDIARAKNIPIVADYGDSENWHLAKDIAHLIVAEECVLQLFNSTDPGIVLPKIKHFAGQVVGLTLGAKGFYYDAGQGIQHIPAFPVNVVDTTGAGDIFHGAYTFALGCGFSVNDCGLLASAVAAISCRGFGRSVLPTLDETLRFLSARSVRLSSLIRN